MKIGLYSDTHFGIFGDDDVFLKYQLEVIKTIHDDFAKQGIKRIYILGDIFDDRRKLNVKTLNLVRDFYSQEDRFNIGILLGNHDYFNKTDNNYSSVKPVFEDMRSVVTFEKMTHVVHDELKILLCPWVFYEEDFLADLKKESPNLVLGHFEMKGFEVVKNHLMKTGMDKSVFKNHEMVLSGHYHIAQKQDNIVYLGSPYQMDWNDYGVEKFYYIYDIATRKLKSIKNENDIFVVAKLSEIKDDDIQTFKDRIVKVVIDADDQKYIEEIQKVNPLKFRVEDRRQAIKEAEEEIDTNTDVLTISKEFIDKKVVDEIDKDKLFDVFSEVYKEAKVL